MSNEFLFTFINKYKLAVMSSVTTDDHPESALVGFAITPDLKIIFDTLSDSRKSKNLLVNPRISFVIGWDSEKTLQYEGIAKIPDEGELETLLPIYFEAFPDGKIRKENWKNLVYFCVEPRWIRYSDFNESNRVIKEFRF